MAWWVAHAVTGPSQDTRASPYRRNPRATSNIGTALLDDYFNTTVLGTPRFRIVTGDRITVPVAFSRQVAAHAAVPKRLSGTIGSSVRKLLVGRELLLQRTLDRNVVGVSRHMYLLFREIFEDVAHALQRI